MAQETAPRLAIGLITRGRPGMLRRCLDSLGRLSRPAGVGELVVAVVENAPELTIGPLLDDFQAASGLKVLRANEPVPGIPAARNKVLDLVLEAGFDHLAFIDDDEVADPDWLDRLWEVHEGRGLDLTGGPVAILPPEDPSSEGLQARLVRRGLERRNDTVARRATAHVARGSDDKVTVVTNNWLVRLDFLRRTGVRFDAGLGLSNGSDTRFWRDLTAAGGRSGWAPDAWVREEMPASRLTFGYQFRRGRDQTLASMRTRGRRGGLRGLPSAVGFAVAKTVLAAGRVLAAPFNRGATLVLAARALGAATGRLAALRSDRGSDHYRVVHGT